METPDAWKLDSGFLPAEITLAIHASYFSTHADANPPGSFYLYLVGSDESGEPFELRMPCGSDWTSQDGGKTIVHPKRKHIAKNSIYGRFIDGALAIDDVVGGTTLRDVLFSRGDPMQAEIWSGLVIHMSLTTIEFGPTIEPVDRLIPDRWLGLYQEQAAPATPPPATPPAQLTLPPQPATATVPPATATPSPADVVAQARAAAANGPADSPLLQQMIDLAKSCATHLEFQQKAFAMPEVLADEALAIRVADEASGIWPLAKA